MSIANLPALALEDMERSCHLELNPSVEATSDPHLFLRMELQPQLTLQALQPTRHLLPILQVQLTSQPLQHMKNLLLHHLMNLITRTLLITVKKRRITDTATPCLLILLYCLPRSLLWPAFCYLMMLTLELLTLLMEATTLNPMESAPQLVFPSRQLLLQLMACLQLILQLLQQLLQGIHQALLDTTIQCLQILSGKTYCQLDLNCGLL